MTEIVDNVPASLMLSVALVNSVGRTILTSPPVRVAKVCRFVICSTCKFKLPTIDKKIEILCGERKLDIEKTRNFSKVFFVPPSEKIPKMKRGG